MKKPSDLKAKIGKKGWDDDYFVVNKKEDIRPYRVLLKKVWFVIISINYCIIQLEENSIIIFLICGIENKNFLFNLITQIFSAVPERLVKIYKGFEIQRSKFIYN